ncbi:MAG: hypothetical protein Q9181_003533 [Wetmoreana brouardii]
MDVRKLGVPNLPRLFPHSIYAEDQRYAHTILTIHCLHRGFTAGAIFGLLTPLARSAFTTILRRPTLAQPLPYTGRLLSSAAIGSLSGTALLTVGMTARMWGREEVEWQDRSWRILANTGQNREDAWSFSNILVSALSMVFLTRRGREWPSGIAGITRWRVIVGAAAMGSVLGTVEHVLTSSKSVEDVERKVVAGEGPLKPK